MKWRRSWDIRCPALEDGDERLSENDRRYDGVPPTHLPRAEVIIVLLNESA